MEKRNNLTKKDLLQLINIEGIRKEIIKYSQDVIRKYFRLGIFYVHGYAANNNKGQLTLYGSALIRYETKEAIEIIYREKKGEKPSLENVAGWLKAAGGEGDGFIKSRIEDGLEVAKIKKAFLEAVKIKAGI